MAKRYGQQPMEEKSLSELKRLREATRAFGDYNPTVEREYRKRMLEMDQPEVDALDMRNRRAATSQAESRAKLYEYDAELGKPLRDQLAGARVENQSRNTDLRARGLDLRAGSQENLEMNRDRAFQLAKQSADRRYEIQNRRIGLTERQQQYQRDYNATRAEMEAIKSRILSRNAILNRLTEARKGMTDAELQQANEATQQINEEIEELNNAYYSAAGELKSTEERMQSDAAPDVPVPTTQPAAAVPTTQPAVAPAAAPQPQPVISQVVQDEVDGMTDDEVIAALIELARAGKPTAQEALRRAGIRWE